MHKVISFKKEKIGGWDHNSFNWMNSPSTQLGKLVKPLLALMCIVSLISNEDDSSSDGVSLLTMAVFTMSPFYFTALYVAMSAKGALAAPVGGALEDGLVLSRDLRVDKRNLINYANASTFEEFMEDIEKSNQSALVFQNYFDSLIKKYSLFSVINFTDLRAGKNPVVLDRVPKRLPDYFFNPEPISKILLKVQKCKFYLRI